MTARVFDRTVPWIAAAVLLVVAVRGALSVLAFFGSITTALN